MPCMVTPDGPDVDKPARALQGHLSAGFDDHFHPRLQMNLLAGVHGELRADLLVAGAANAQRPIPINLLAVFPFDRGMHVSADNLGLVALYVQLPVVSDRFLAVVQDDRVHVLLGMRDDNSLPLVSSMENSLYPPPPLVLLDLIPLMFCKPGRPHGGICSALYTRPGDDGPVRDRLPENRQLPPGRCAGSRSAPQFFPAQGCETRIQHELFSSFLPTRSQWNWTLTRPYLSV